MPIGLIIFFIYLVIVIFSRMQQQNRRAAQNAEKKLVPPDDREIPFIPGFDKNEDIKPEKRKGRDSTENAKTIIDDEIVKTLQKKSIKQTEELPKADHLKNEIFPENHSILPDFHEDNLINGIVLSELLGLPRALKSEKQLKRFRIIQ